MKRVEVSNNPYRRRADAIYMWVLIGRCFLVKDIVLVIAKLVHAEVPDFSEYLRPYVRDRKPLIPLDVFITSTNKKVQWEILTKTMHYYMSPCEKMFYA